MFGENPNGLAPPCGLSVAHPFVVFKLGRSSRRVCFAAIAGGVCVLALDNVLVAIVGCDIPFVETPSFGSSSITLRVRSVGAVSSNFASDIDLEGTAGCFISLPLNDPAVCPPSTTLSTSFSEILSSLPSVTLGRFTGSPLVDGPLLAVISGKS